MPIPTTKLYLSSALSAGRAIRFIPNAPGDFAPPLGGNPVAPWLASVNDVNADGRVDLIFASPSDSDKFPAAGRVFVETLPFAGGATLTLGDSLTQMVIDGVNAGDRAGAAVGSIADLNGDGRGEILVGAPGMEVGAFTDAGAGFVVFGKAAGGVDLQDLFTATSGGYAIKGQAAGDAAGSSMMSIADLNGDGKADVVIGAPGNDSGGGNAGAVYVVWGKSTLTNVDLSTVAAGTGGFKIIGDSGGDMAGAVIGTTADMNGDGKSEILIGTVDSALGGAKSGAAFVVFGKSTGTAVDLTNIAAGAGGGFVIKGVAGDDAGATISGIGDINGDGVGDILVGAPRSDRAYVVYGKSTSTAVDLADVRNGVGGFQILAENVGDLDKLSVTGGRDLNHDGIADIVIGTPDNAEGGSNAGAVYIVWGGGHSTVDLSLVSQSIGGAKIVGDFGSQLGYSVAITSDLNGDGNLDLLVGAPGTGESAYVIYGDASWQPDTNVYGTNGVDNIGPGYGATHVVGDGIDNIIALAGNDVINAAGGNDVIDGGTGADAMTGGLGDDTYYVDDIGDTTIEALGGGTDTVIASINYTLAANVENLVLAGFATSGTGNALANTITGTANNDTLDGKAGADAMIGGLGSDTYFVDNVGDTAVEALNAGIDTVSSSIDYTLGLNLENLILTGSARIGTGNDLANSLTGTAFNDTLDGKLGADIMSGGFGDDTYFVDNAGDQTIEALTAGTDSVMSSVNYTLGLNVENLTLTGAARNGTGNALANSITGTTGNDVLDGGAGADTLIGGLGDDTYLVDNIGDVITEIAGQGTDTVVASFDYTLGAGSIENLTLTGAAHHGVGNAVNNTITGGIGADTLEGGGGIDTLIGGAGDDIYVVDSTTDIITEAVGGGTDTIVSSIDYVMANGSNIENLTLTGTAHHATGNDGNNVLTGGAGIDTLDGGLGNDTLVGSAGSDIMNGGAGDDTYFVSDIGDVVNEAVGGGTDTVVVSSDWTLADNIENVTLVGTGHTLIGNAANNTLSGDVGNDTLDGGLGDDTEIGGEGNDHLISTSGHDILAGGAGDDVYEIHGGAAHIEDFQGHDTIDASGSHFDDHIDLSGETQTEIEHEICDFGSGGTITGALNVQFLQDLTGSFADDIANVRTLVPQIVTALQTVNGGAAFGVSSFRDKAFGAFGGAGDYVYLTNLAMGATPAALTAAYTAMVASGGSDLPEAQIEALMQLGLRSSGEVHYQSNAAHFAVLFTDAPFHTAADGLAAGLTLANNGDAILDPNENYPELAQLAAALQAANIIPIFAVTAGLESIYTGLTTAIGRGTVVTLTANSSNIVSAITTGLTTATTTHLADAVGGTGNDTIIGNIGVNALSGGDGNDTLDGRQSNDRLHGGAGSDTAVYSGVLTDYTIVNNADGTTTITDNRATGGDGVDTLDGVEFLRIGGSTYTITGAAIGTAPILTNDTATGIIEATRLSAGVDNATGNVLSNDSATAGPLVVSGIEAGTTGTLTVVTGATVISGIYGTLTINVNGSYSYALDNLRPATEALNTGDTANDVFTYEAKDANGVAVTAQLSVAIAGATDVPAPTITPVNDKLLVTVGQASSVDAAVLLGNDTISNGEGMTVTGVSNVVGGTVALVGGKLVITATGAVAGFDYTITSATGVVATGHADVTGIVSSALANTMTSLPAYAAADLVGLDGNDKLTGSTGADRLVGGLGLDTLNGGLGADLMIGGAGNDTYTVDNVGDSVVELLNEGTDTVRTTLASYSLGADVENLTSIGTADFHGFGNGLANVLTGGVGQDTLEGGLGNDTLNGGINADIMIGGAGNDTYNVDNVLDQVVEALNDGVDTVRTTLSDHSLLDNLENLVSTGVGPFHGIGNAAANAITGGAGNDTLEGGLGNDVLTGGLGGDNMIGGLGNDVYSVDNVLDVVTELAAQGTDTVNTTLSAYTLGDNVENLVAKAVGSFHGIGNASANTMTGNIGSDILEGGGGKDILLGGAGADRLVGGAAADTLTGGADGDTFVFDWLGLATDKDTVKDFVAASDHVELSRAVFSAFGGHALGALNAADLALGTVATTIDQHLVYNAVNGSLFYDVDGSGAAAQVQIATFSNFAVLGASEFILA
jgi:VCBS repeat-containing protein